MKKCYSLLICCFILLNNSQAQAAEKIYLSGTGYGDTKDWNFFCSAGRKSGYWTTIAVPSCWEQQGFGNYNYGRDYKTYGKNFSFSDEKGLYLKKFKVPVLWKGKSIRIVFEGCMTDAEVKVNGQLAGNVHQGAFYEFSYDISKLVKYGADNTLEVLVSKMSADKSVNNAERLADYWVFGGIYRPVFLEAKPAEHISNIAVKALANGEFECRVQTVPLSKNTIIKAHITDAFNKTIVTLHSAIGNGDSMITLKKQLNNILPWSSEAPNLYNLTVSIISGNRIIYTQQQKIGFRTIEIKKGQGIFINSVQVKMKGVNRHCFWPESGRTLNDSINLADALLLKQMNMNAVRCSHYPPDKKFLEYCDSLGIFVIDELAGWQKAYSTEAGAPLVKEMVMRDRNHPSIIFWANGNEGGTNKKLDSVFTAWDFSGRPVIHPHHRPGNAFNGIDCDHYEDYYSTLKKFQQGENIYMPTEMLHAQDDGGGGAGMYDFWELHWKNKLSGGVFIWAMIDEAIQRTDFNNRLDANGLNANDGILGPHREKEGSYYALRNIFSPVQLISKQIDSLVVENRFHFTNLKDCRFEWELVNYAKPFSNDSSYATIKKGTIVSPDIKPGEKGKLLLTLPQNYQHNDALTIAAKDPKGNEVYKWFIAIKNNAVYSEAILKNLQGAAKPSPVLTQNDSMFILSAADISVQVDKKTGLLNKVINSKASPISFNNGPVNINGNHTIEKTVVTESADSISIRFNTTGSMQKIVWTIYNSGWIKLNYHYQGGDSVQTAGVSFNYPENYVLGVNWLGKGPSRIWRNRMAGTEHAVYSNLYNNTQTGYNPAVYPEFKGYFGNINWMQFSTVEGNFLLLLPDEKLHVRLFDFYGLTGINPLPVLPTGNISIMDVIPAIGTKLALNINSNTASLGPQGEAVKQPSVIEHNILFYFGTPEINKKTERYSRPAIDEVF